MIQKNMHFGIPKMEEWKGNAFQYILSHTKWQAINNYGI